MTGLYMKGQSETTAFFFFKFLFPVSSFNQTSHTFYHEFLFLSTHHLLTSNIKYLSLLKDTSVQFHLSPPTRRDTMFKNSNKYSCDQNYKNIPSTSSQFSLFFPHFKFEPTILLIKFLIGLNCERSLGGGRENSRKCVFK